MTAPSSPMAGLDASTAVEREVLRFLYVLHFATTDQLCRLLWNAATTSTLRKRLAPPLLRLYALDCVWRTARRTAPGYRTQRNGYASGGWYYGLTDAGRRLALQHFPQLVALRCLTREGYLNDGERRLIAHSAHATEWCTLLIGHVRQSPHLVGLFVEMESTVMGGHLRMDGLIRLRLWREPQPMTQGRPTWYLPWAPTLRLAVQSGTFDATFALEIDEGTEQLEILERKGLNYARTYVGAQLVGNDADRDTMLTPVDWPQVMCPVATPPHLDAQRHWFPIPVFVLPNQQRLAHVWAAWQRGWSGAEVRMTTWQHLHQAPSVLHAPYLNQQHIWVDLLGRPFDLISDVH